ncbi:carbohydrate ABC transporter permease [Paenibacillus eucommiae]|uniref:Oligogalacturonide transport system permease protein n=1 Tax=Paenibacillus eucommiae TaxID=1355755 RepID=A0ABS4J9I9_9BACL|nr:sugar ABC transporter permease [Paenibacillus eucommiae]MBP1996517.1 oligogalacturonide transport system permease protein [Paenibacillus eucommiae]
MVSVKKYKNYTGLLYILPWIIGFAVFQFYPMIASLYYSFTDYSLGRAPKFIGIKNFTDMFTIDPNFIQSLKVTLLYFLMAVPLKLAFALLIAVILNVNIKFINFFRTVYYIPSILGGSVAIAILWRAMFLQDGMVNRALAFIHIPKIEWFGSPFIALFTLSLLTVWQFGSSMVLFLAGLKQVPKELYEAGTMDGASKIRMFFKITLPMLTPIIFFNLVMQMITALQEFTSAFVVTNGAPMKGTYLYGMKLYEEAFSNFKMGYASALSWVLFIIILIITYLIFRSSKRWVHYEDGGDF